MRVLITGPDTLGISGEPTHLRTLFSSPLSERFELFYHRVGGGERRLVPENPLKRYFYRVASLWLFLRKLSAVKPQVVHINNTFNFKGLARDCSLVLLAKARGVKVVFEMHGGQPEEWARKHPILKRLVLFALRRADRVVVLSEEQRAFVERWLGPGRAVLVPNMVEVRVQKPPEPAEPPYFLFLGRLLRTKGVREAAEAARLAGVKVIFAGDGPERERLRGLERVELAGFAVGRRKDELIKGAYAVLLPSYHEGMPYALLEAMAWGVPVIASEVGGVPHLVRHGVEGLLIPPGDARALAEAMEKLLGNPKLRYNLARGALKRAWEFSVQELWKAYSEVYKGVIE